MYCKSCTAIPDYTDLTPTEMGRQKRRRKRQKQKCCATEREMKCFASMVKEDDLVPYAPPPPSDSPRQESPICVAPSHQQGNSPSQEEHKQNPPCHDKYTREELQEAITVMRTKLGEYRTENRRLQSQNVKFKSGKKNIVGFEAGVKLRLLEIST